MFVCSYTQTTFLTQAESENINAQHDGVALPREKEETHKRATTKTGEGDSAPHEHAVVAARPSTGPAGAAAHGLFIRAAHVIPHLKRTQTKQPLKK